MPKAKNPTVLIDYSHGEILNISDNDFLPFSKLLSELGYSTPTHTSGKITEKILEKADIFVIGCPVNHYFLAEEIRAIVDYVMAGGCVLVLSEYGGDMIQKTNLNELTKFWGIYFEHTAIHTDTNTGSTSLVVVDEIVQHEITKNVRKIAMGGCSSIRVGKEAIGVCTSGRESWIEIYDELNNVWVKINDIDCPLIAAVTYGQGRVIAIGDIDIIGASTQFGLNSLDNRRLVQNMFQWFNQPVRSETTIEWLIGQISNHREDITHLTDVFNNLVDTVKLLETRFSEFEEKQLQMQKTILENRQILLELKEKEEQMTTVQGKVMNKEYGEFLTGESLLPETNEHNESHVQEEEKTVETGGDEYIIDAASYDELRKLNLDLYKKELENKRKSADNKTLYLKNE